MLTSDHTPTPEELNRVALAFDVAEKAIGECYHGGDRFNKVRESLRPLLHEHLKELAMQLEQHDLGGALWKAADAFDEYFTRDNLSKA